MGTRRLFERATISVAFHSFCARVAAEELGILDHGLPEAERVVDDLRPHALVVEDAQLRLDVALVAFTHQLDDRLAAVGLLLVEGGHLATERLAVDVHDLVALELLLRGMRAARSGGGSPPDRPVAQRVRVAELAQSLVTDIVRPPPGRPERPRVGRSPPRDRTPWFHTLYSYHRSRSDGAGAPFHRTTGRGVGPASQTEIVGPVIPLRSARRRRRTPRRWRTPPGDANHTAAARRSRRACRAGRRVSPVPMARSSGSAPLAPFLGGARRDDPGRWRWPRIPCGPSCTASREVCERRLRRPVPEVVLERRDAGGRRHEDDRAPALPRRCGVWLARGRRCW